MKQTRTFLAALLLTTLSSHAMMRKSHHPLSAPSDRTTFLVNKLQSQKIKNFNKLTARNPNHFSRNALNAMQSSLLTNIADKQLALTPSVIISV